MLYKCLQSDIQYHNPSSVMKSFCHIFMPRLLNKHEKNVKTHACLVILMCNFWQVHIQSTLTSKVGFHA